MRAVVTGGGGFLGRGIVEALLARGDEVVSIGRGAYPELEALGASTLRADLGRTTASELAPAFAGAQVVFHVAAKAGVWGARADYVAANVEGTRRVLEASRAAGVQRLVLTSSPSVCFDGKDHVRVAQLPRATRFLAPYPETKALAEAEVLAANDTALATCALRPHLIFGPRDPHLIPRLLERARAGKLTRVGRGDNEVSMTWIENAVHAHLCAADALELGAPHAGQAYFVAQEEPVRLWTWIEALLARLDLPAPRRRVPLGVACAAGGALELVWRALRVKGEPPITRFVAMQLAASHSYDITPARRDFGYVEQVGMGEATERLIASLGG